MRVLSGFLLIKNTSIPHFLLSLLSLLFRFTELSIKSSVSEYEICIFPGHSCRFSISKTDKTDLVFWNQFHRTNLTKVCEKFFELLFSAVRINVSNNQIQKLHAFFEFESRFLKFCLSLTLILKLTDIKSLLVSIFFVCLRLREMVKSFLSIFSSFEANKSKALGNLVFILHNADTCKCTKFFESVRKPIFSAIFRWEVLHIKVCRTEGF